MRYPGGKGSSGTYQNIINQIPPHKTYIEPFLGGGAIIRTKRPADINIGIELCDDVILRYWNHDTLIKYPWIQIINTDGINFVDPFGENRQALSDLNTFVYCDPPYLIHTRLSRKIIYKHEMTIHQHTRLLRNLLNIDCMVAISGYPAPLYAHHLASWRSFEYQQVTRSGKTVTEVLWMNYPEPTHLHDYNFLGRNYRERERIKKKIARWTAKLKSLPGLEREAIMEALDQERSQ